MTGHIFISYKSEEHEFTLKVAADLKNVGIQVWVDRLDGGIEVGDQWTRELDTALKTSSALIAVLTPDYFGSRVCQDELDFAYRENLPIFPLLLRPTKNTVMPYWLPGRQRVDFINWYEDAFYAHQLQQLISRIRQENQSAVGAFPTPETQYLNTLIAELESYQGVEEYIALAGQAETIRENPRALKKIEPSLALLVKKDTSSHNNQQLERKPIDNIQEAVEKYPTFVLIGDSGAGKTTTMRRLVLEAARECQKNPEKPLPLIIYLSTWNVELTIQDFIHKQWQLEGDVLALLRVGKIRLYLDGLNEMGSEGKVKTEILRNWLHSHDAPQHVIVTCRKDEYQGDFDLNLPTVLVQELSDDQIKEFVDKYLGENAHEFLIKVFPTIWAEEIDERRSLLQLARNPYLLTALILVYQNNGSFPSNKGGLFRDLIMSLWDRESRRKTQGWIPFEQMQVAFGQLAFAIIDEEVPHNVPLSYVIDKVGNYDLVRLSISASFAALTSGLFSFSHQLILEFFAAQGLSQVNLKEKLKRPFFPSQRQPTKWDKVVIAFCGLTNDASQIVSDVTDVDPFLAVECIISGVQIQQEIYDRAISNLKTELYSQESEVQFTAIEIFGRLRDKSITHDIRLTLKNHDPFVRRISAQALGILGDKEALSDLQERLSDSDFVVRIMTAWALGQIGDKAAVPALLTTLQTDTNSNVRAIAAEALGNIGDKSITSHLREALFDSSVDVTSMAAIAVGKLSDLEAIYILRDLLRNHASGLGMRVCDAAAEALKNIGTLEAISCVLPFFTANLRDPEKTFSIKALEALEEIDTLESRSAIEEWEKEQGKS